MARGKGGKAVPAGDAGSSGRRVPEDAGARPSRGVLGRRPATRRPPAPAPPPATRPSSGRWPNGAPPKGNANFAWVQHIVHHLAPAGVAGFVLANGSKMTRLVAELRAQQAEGARLDAAIAANLGRWGSETTGRAESRLDSLCEVITVCTASMPKGGSDMGKAAATTDVKLIAIGNSKGIRLPKVLIRKYGWSDSLVLQEMEEGIFLHGKQESKLSWPDTYRAMATDGEDWSDLDATLADGLD